MVSGAGVHHLYPIHFYGIFERELKAFGIGEVFVVLS